MWTIALWLGLAACAAWPQHLPHTAAAARAALARQGRGPLDLNQLRELVGLLPDEALAGEMAERGINFTPSAEVVADLSRRGAGARTVAALRALIPNRPPAVSLRVDAEEVMRGESLIFVAEASDPDGEEVRYDWSATGGAIEGDGPLVRLNTAALSVTARPLRITVTVTVSDRRGGSASASQTVQVRGRYVRPSPPPPAPLRVVNEGKDLLIYLAPAVGAGPSDSVVVYLNAPDAGVGLGHLVGGLPGKPCRVRFEAIENVADLSLKEPPGAGNAWRTLVARVRPKNLRRPIRFSINCSILRGPPG